MPSGVILKDAKRPEGSLSPFLLHGARVCAYLAFRCLPAFLTNARKSAAFFTGV